MKRICILNSTLYILQNITYNVFLSKKKEIEER